MSRMCFITPGLDTASGWGRYASDVIAGARAAGHKVHVVELRGGGIAFLGSVPRALWECRTADIVYAIDGWPFGVFAWFATRIWRNRLVIGAIGTYTIAPFKQWHRGWLMRRAYSAADAVIAISAYTRDRLLERAPDARITIVTPGIPYERWHRGGEGIRPLRMISVAPLKPRKGYHAALEAFALARRRIPDLRWTIVGGRGSRSYMEKFDRRAAELGVADAIAWHERVSDERLRGLYADSRLFILLSENFGGRFEGFGIVFLEAAAAGLPVIGTTGNGIADAVGLDNGILVPQGDAQVAADAIVGILTDDQRWRAMSDASRTWAASHDTARMHRVHEEIYRRLMR